MKKVLVVFGTRPEAIKMAPVIHALKKELDLHTILCVTGQHREMLDQVLNLYHIIPDYDLDIMKPNQTLINMTIQMMSGLNKVFEEVQPDMVLVHGDTTTSFVAALVAFYHRCEIAHVEAGLRSRMRYSPFPEELNRILIDHLATIHFAPTPNNKQNLIDEDINEKRIYVTGNTGIDALTYSLKTDINHELLDVCLQYKVILLTAHRRENLDAIDLIYEAILEVINNYPDSYCIYPVHLNPKIQSKAGILANHPRIKCVEPLDTFTFHHLLNQCYCIVTDSGGIQEEATFLGKPTLLVRDTTERQEGIECQNIQKVGVNKEMIINSLKQLLTDINLYQEMSTPQEVFGDGQAALRIIQHIKEILTKEGYHYESLHDAIQSLHK